MNYPGGKGGCYHHIINLMPPHRVYIETHLGGGNVLERLRPAQSTIGIDVDAAVIDLWKSLPEYQGPDYTFINGDAGSIIQRMKLKGDEVIYSDPPYLMSTRKSGPLYNHEMSDEQHREWLEILLSVDCPAIISGYKSEMYMDMLAGWNYRTFQNTTRQGIVTEYAWFNYELTAAKADYRYLGENFREREQIKRQRTRWVDNFNGLPPSERLAMYEALTKALAESVDVAGDIVIKGEGGRPRQIWRGMPVDTAEYGDDRCSPDIASLQG